MPVTTGIQVRARSK